MNVMEAIKGRTSIRQYLEKPIEQEKLNQVLEAARLAPSAGNGQNWKFLVVQDYDLRQKMIEACNNQSFVGQAPAILVTIGTKPVIMSNKQPMDAVDLSIAMSFMILEAYELGLGTCWLAAFDQDAVKKLLNIPDEVSVVAVSPLGYPAVPPSPRPRKAMEELVCYDTYQ